MLPSPRTDGAASRPPGSTYLAPVSVQSSSIGRRDVKEGSSVFVSAGYDPARTTPPTPLLRRGRFVQGCELLTTTALRGASDALVGTAERLILTSNHRLPALHALHAHHSAPPDQPPCRECARTTGPSALLSADAAGGSTLLSFSRIVCWAYCRRPPSSFSHPSDWPPFADDATKSPRAPIWAS